MKLNSKGFTLVEVLAVIVILGVISTILISSVGSMLVQNSDDSLKNLKNSIKSSVKLFISDHRYDIELDSGTTCVNNDNKRNIYAIEGVDNISNSRITLKMLIDDKLLSTDNNKIINPKNNREVDTNLSYIEVYYNCKTKDYQFGEPHLVEK